MTAVASASGDVQARSGADAAGGGHLPSFGVLAVPARLFRYAIYRWAADIGCAATALLR